MRTPQLADNLRRAVLQAAIEGKLSERLPGDGDARELLAQIHAEKQRKIAAGETKKEKPLPPVSADEIPFAIPENWQWVRLGEIGNIQTGNTPSKSEKENYGTDFPFFKPADLSQGNNIVKPSEFLSFIGRTKARIVPRDSLLINGIGNVGNLGIVRIEGAFNQQMHSLTPYNGVMLELAYLFLQSSYLQKMMLSDTSQTTIPILNKNNFSMICFPLPPLAEQQRIVEKLNRLLNEIDSLKAQEQALLTAQNAFPKKLRAAILQAAMQGELNERTNENARDLLAAIQTEKAALQKTGKLKKDKPLAAISEEEIPFAIPDNWVWVRLGEIGQIVGGGTPKTAHSEYWDNGDIPWITPADMRNLTSKYIERGTRNITKTGLNSSSAQLLPKNSILFSSRAPIGYVAIAQNEMATNQGFKSVAPFKTEMSEYLYFVLLTLKPEIEKLGTGTTFKEVSGTTVGNVVIPLPPLTEQQQIVAKLEALLAEIDILENAA